MRGEEFKLIYFCSSAGKYPFREWFFGVCDFKAQAVMDARLTRLRSGNFGKCEPVGSGVFELKIYYGPGYRIYFSRVGRRVILLLCGGDKSRQQDDIARAQRYLDEYHHRQGIR